MPSIRHFLMALTVLVGAIPKAEAQQKIFESGQWSVYIAENVLVPDRTGVLPRACSAETRIQNGVLSFSLDQQFLITSVRSPNWNFQRRISVVSFGAGGDDPSVSLVDANYKGDTIRHMTPGSIQMLRGISGVIGEGAKAGDIKVIDDRNRVIAVFSGRGFASAVDRVIDCAQKL